MKNTKQVFAKIAKAVAENALKRDANSTTCAAIYQPKAPANLIRYRKAEK